MILINGCSFTAGVGLNSTNDAFTNQLCLKFNLNFKNISLPAASNDRIRSSTIQEILLNDYSYVFINFTNIPRIYLGETFGLKTILLKTSTVSKFNKNLKNFWNLFFDELFWVKQYFENIYILQEFLKMKKIPYVFTNTSEFIHFEMWIKNKNFVDAIDGIPTYFNNFYNFTHFKNYEKSIVTEYNSIINLIRHIDISKFSDLNKKKLFGSGFETGNDNMHPGKEAHDYMTSILTEYLQSDELFKNLTKN